MPPKVHATLRRFVAVVVSTPAVERSIAVEEAVDYHCLHRMSVQRLLFRSSDLTWTKFASQNSNDHGGREVACNHSDAEIAGFFASPAAKNRNRAIF